MTRRRDDAVGVMMAVQEAMSRKIPYLMILRPSGESLEEEYMSMITDKSVAITITFQPKYQFLPEVRLRDIVTDVLKTLGIKRAYLYPDLDNNDKFHYHGILDIKKKDRHKVKRLISLHVGYIKFDYIKDEEGWFLYMRKPQGFMSREHKVPLTEAVYDDDDIDLYRIKILE